LDVAGRERDDADGGHAPVRLEQVAGSRCEEIDVGSDAGPERAAAAELAFGLADADFDDVPAHPHADQAGRALVVSGGLLGRGDGRLAPQEVARRGERGDGEGREPGGDRATHGAPHGNRARARACAALAAVAWAPAGPGSLATTPNQCTRPSVQSMTVAASASRPGWPSGPGRYAADVGISAKRASTSAPRRTRSPKSGSPTRWTCA